MKAIPKGPARDAALTRLKDSGETTAEAAAEAGHRHAGERVHAAVRLAKLDDPLQRGK